MNKKAIRILAVLLILTGIILVLYQGNRTGNMIQDVGKGMEKVRTMTIFLLLLPFVAILLGLILLVISGIKSNPYKQTY